MMLDKIIRFILRFKLKREQRESSYLDMDHIQSVLVIFETQHVSVITPFIKELESMDKTVQGYALRSDGDARVYMESNYTILDSKDNTVMLGIPHKDIIKDLQSEHFDAVFDMTIDENLILEYVLVSADATMKVGLKKNELPFYDFAITGIRNIEPENIDSESDCETEISPVADLANTILHYLRMIKSSIP